MKILKICGIAAGVHALFALILILASPGCTSTSASSKAALRPTPSDTTVRADPPAPAAGANTAVLPSSDPAPSAIAPAAADSPAGPGPNIVFSPTRPGTAAAAALSAQPVADVTPVTTYAVGKGDSLWSIAKKKHIKISELAAANNLKPGASLHPGQKLIIPGAAPAAAAPAAPPGGATAAIAPAPAAAVAGAGSAEGIKHVVRAGETLGAIARKYNVRMGDIAAANNISDPQKIHPGQTLIIPAGHPAGAKAARAAKSAASAPAHGAGAEPAAEVPAVPAITPAPPAPGQDLDSGLKPTDASAPPVIKVEDAPPPK